MYKLTSVNSADLATLTVALLLVMCLVCPHDRSTHCLCWLVTKHKRAVIKLASFGLFFQMLFSSGLVCSMNEQCTASLTRQGCIAGYVQAGMINCMCASMLCVFHTQPSMAVNSRLQSSPQSRGSARSALVLISHASAVITWVALPSRSHHPKGYRFSRPMTEPPITDSVCSLGRDGVV